MTLLDVNIDEINEPVLLPEGEHELRCTGVQDKTQGETYPGVVLILEAQGGGELTAPIFHRVFFPRPEIDDEQKQARARLDLKRICQAFGVPGSPIDFDNFIGQSAWAYVVRKSSEQYGENNNVKRWVAPTS